MAFITYPIAAGTKIAALSITGGDLALSALALSDGTPVDNSNPVPVAGLVSWTSAQHVIVDSVTGTVTVGGSVSVTGSSVNAIQSGAWTVAVSNFPSTFAATQSGSWNVGITGTLPAFASTPTVILGAGSAAVGSVSVSNFPATQTVSGTVAATQSGSWTTAAAQSGTWTITQGTGGSSAWKVDGSAATQPISAASLPLPTGAATENGNLATIAAAGFIAGWTAYFNGSFPAAGAAIKGSAGVLTNGSAYNGTPGLAYLQAHDSATVGGISSSTIKATAIAGTSATGSGTLTLPTGGLVFTSGIVLAWSTAQGTYAAPASNSGWAQAGYK